MAAVLYQAPLRLNDSTGAPAPNVTVTVSATVYADPAGLVPYPNNQVVTDANGNISFYAPAASYTLTYTPTNGVTKSVITSLPLSLSSASSTALIGSTQSVAFRSFTGQGVTTPTRSNLEFTQAYSGALTDTAALGGASSGVMVAVPSPWTSAWSSPRCRSSSAPPRRRPRPTVSGRSIAALP